MDEDDEQEKETAAVDMSGSDACSTRNEETEEDNNDITYSSSDIDYVIEVRLITSDSEGNVSGSIAQGEAMHSSSNDSVADAEVGTCQVIELDESNVSTNVAEISMDLDFVDVETVDSDAPIEHTAADDLKSKLHFSLKRLSPEVKCISPVEQQALATSIEFSSVESVDVEKKVLCPVKQSISDSSIEVSSMKTDCTKEKCVSPVGQQTQANHIEFSNVPNADVKEKVICPLKQQSVDNIEFSDVRKGNSVVKSVSPDERKASATGSENLNEPGNKEVDGNVTVERKLHSARNPAKSDGYICVQADEQTSVVEVHDYDDSESLGSYDGGSHLDNTSTDAIRTQELNTQDLNRKSGEGQSVSPDDDSDGLNRSLTICNLSPIHFKNITKGDSVSALNVNKLDSVCEATLEPTLNATLGMKDSHTVVIHPTDRQDSSLESDACTVAETNTWSDGSDVRIRSEEDGNSQKMNTPVREMSEDIFSDTSPASDVEKNNAFINEQLLILNSESSHLNTSIHKSACRRIEQAENVSKSKHMGKKQSTPKKAKLGGRIRKPVKRKLEEFDCTELRAKKQECSTNPDSDSDSISSLQIDEENIDDKLEKNASAKGLTATNVKNILHHLITNDDVVDMVKNSVMEGMTGDEKDMVEAAFEPKMTRAAVRKAIETGQVADVWPLSPLKKKKAKPSILDMDFPEDEDDDEYNPDNDAEAHESDDDESIMSSHVSEFGSPCPPTPSTPSSNNPPVSTNTPLLSQEKMMSPPNTSPDNARSSVLGQQFRQAMESIISSSVVEEQNNGTIAERTRSKLPLKDTSLIAIEEALCYVAPDITPDMYDTYCDDSDWQDFIRSLIGPEFELPDPVEVVDDETVDPEYDYLAEADTVVTDPEDFRFDRPFRVSKKELNELIDELHLLFPEQDDEDERIECSHQEPAVKPVTVAEMARAEVMSPNLRVSLEQKLIIEDHMRKHIQLACQMYVLCLGSEDYQSMVPSCVQILRELELFRTVSVAGVNSSFNVCNLPPALELIDGEHSWNISKEIEDLSHDDTGSNATDSDVDSVEFAKSRSAYKKAVKKKDSLLLSQKDLVWNSPVFLYPHLLLKRRLLSQDDALDSRTVFTPAEDNLIALGMEQFHHLPFYCKFIQKYLMPCKSVSQIMIRIKNLCTKKAVANPVKYFRRHKKVPEFAYVIDHFTPERMKSPKNQDMCLLPGWCLKYREFVRKEYKTSQSLSQITKKKRSTSLSLGEAEEMSEPERSCHSAPGSPVDNELTSATGQRKKKKSKNNRLTVEDMNKKKPVTLTSSAQTMPRVIVTPSGLFIPIHISSDIRHVTTTTTQASEETLNLSSSASPGTVKGVFSTIPGKTSRLTVSMRNTGESGAKSTQSSSVVLDKTVNHNRIQSFEVLPTHSDISTPSSPTTCVLAPELTSVSPAHSSVIDGQVITNPDPAVLYSPSSVSSSPLTSICPVSTYVVAETLPYSRLGVKDSASSSSVLSVPGVTMSSLIGSPPKAVALPQFVSSENASSPMRPREVLPTAKSVDVINNYVVETSTRQDSHSVVERSKRLDHHSVRVAESPSEITMSDGLNSACDDNRLNAEITVDKTLEKHVEIECVHYEEQSCDEQTKQTATSSEGFVHDINNTSDISGESAGSPYLPIENSTQTCAKSTHSPLQDQDVIPSVAIISYSSGPSPVIPSVANVTDCSEPSAVIPSVAIAPDSSEPSAVIPSVAIVPDSNEPSAVIPSVANVPDSSKPSAVIPSVATDPDSSEPLAVIPSVANVPNSSEPSAVIPSVANVPNSSEPSAVIPSVANVPNSSEPSAVIPSVANVPDSSEPSAVIPSVAIVPDSSEPSAVIPSVAIVPDSSEPSAVIPSVAIVPDSIQPSTSRKTVQNESRTEAVSKPINSELVAVQIESRSPLEIIAALSPYYAQAVLKSPNTKTHQQSILEKTPTKKTPLKTIKPKASSDGPSHPSVSPFLEKIHKSPKRAQLQKQARSILPKGFFVDTKVSPTKIVARGLKRRAQMFAQRASPCKLLPKTESQRVPASIALRPRETKRKRATRKQKRKSLHSVYNNESDFSDEQSDVDDVHTDHSVLLRGSHFSGRTTPKENVFDIDCKLDESDEMPSDDAATLSQDDSQTEDHLDDLMAASTTIRFNSKKQSALDRNSLTKSQKKRELTLAMLAPDLLEIDPRKDEKDTAFAQAYLNRAKETLKDNMDIYEHFLRYMYEFGKGGLPVVKLYSKVQLLFEDYPDLAMDFAAFLSPHQAVTCGCFMANQEFIKARTFLRKLEINFEKQQSQFQRVLKAFHSWFQQPQKLTKDLKEAVQPLLKGMPYLLDEFSRFFPEEKPPESYVAEYEEVTLNDSDLEADAEIDSAEEIDIPEELETYRTKRCRCDCHSNTSDIKLQKRLRHCYNCSLRVIDGKLYFQTSSKKLTPVKITFHKPVMLPQKPAPTDHSDDDNDDDEESDFEVADKENINITSRSMIISPSTSSHVSPAKARRIKLKHFSQKPGQKRFMSLNEFASSQDSPHKKCSPFSSTHADDDADHSSPISETKPETSSLTMNSDTPSQTLANENKEASPRNTNIKECEHFLTSFGNRDVVSGVQSECNLSTASSNLAPSVSRAESRNRVDAVGNNSLRGFFDSSALDVSQSSCSDILANAMKSAHIKPTEESVSIDFFHKLLASNLNIYSTNNSPVKQEPDSLTGNCDKSVETNHGDGKQLTVPSDFVHKLVLAGLTQSRTNSPLKEAADVKLSADIECCNSQQAQLAVDLLQKFAEAGLASSSRTSSLERTETSSVQSTKCKAEHETEESQHALLSMEQMHKFLEAGLRSRTNSPIKGASLDQSGQADPLSDTQFLLSSEFVQRLLEASNSCNNSPSKKSLPSSEKESDKDVLKSKDSQHTMKSIVEPSTSASVREGSPEDTDSSSSDKQMETNCSSQPAGVSSVKNSDEDCMEVVDEDDESNLSPTSDLQTLNETSPRLSRLCKLEVDSESKNTCSPEDDACAMLSAESDSSDEPFLETETSSDMDSRSSEDSLMSDQETESTKQDDTIVWTREMDKVLILRYKMTGSVEDTCKVVSKELKIVTPDQVANRFSQMTAIIEDTEEDWDSDSSSCTL